MQAGSCCLGYEDDGFYGRGTYFIHCSIVGLDDARQSLQCFEGSRLHSRSRESLHRIFGLQQADGGSVRRVGALRTV